MSDVDETGNSYFGSTLDFEFGSWSWKIFFPLLPPPGRINMEHEIIQNWIFK